MLFICSCVLVKEREPQKIFTDLRSLEQDNPEGAWLQDYELTKDPLLGYPPTERMAAVRDLIDNSQHVQRSLPGIHWDERGPNNVGGRTRAIMWDPNDAAHKQVWAGGVDGGLWFTIDIFAAPWSEPK